MNTDLEAQRSVYWNRGRWVLLLGFCLAALNLRPTLSSVSPLLELIRSDLRLSYTAVSLLTTIPSLCMGLFAFSSAALIRRFGLEQSLFWVLVLLAVSAGSRVWADRVMVLFASTLGVGVGIALEQAMLPVVIKTYFSRNTTLISGLFTASITTGAALAASLTAPIRDLLQSWPFALAIWSVPAVMAAVVWYPYHGRQRGSEVERDESGMESHSDPQSLPWSIPGAWMINMMVGGQAFLFLSILTWLPPLYVSLGWSEQGAGYLLTLFMGCQLIGNLTLSSWADRFQDRRPWMGTALALLVLGLTGVSLWPLVATPFWVGVSGFGIGGLFPFCVSLPLDYATDAAQARRLTSLAFGTGYLFAALGPFLIGVIRDVIGAYWVPFLGLVGFSMFLLTLSLRFRPGTLDELSW